MARPLRIVYPGAFYHITSRGNERRRVFLSKRDREQFLSYLESANRRYGARIHCYALMDNHYHLLVETRDANLSSIMHHINASYTIYFNRKRKRYGHLFQGRYKAILVDKDSYAVELSRYIHLNPVRAGVKEKLTDSLTSSLNAYLHPRKKPDYLTTEFILSYFGKTEPAQVRRYRSFVMDAVEEEFDSPLKETIAQTLLGSPDFVSWVVVNFIESNRHPDIPATSALCPRPTIEKIKEETEHVVGKEARDARSISLYLAHRYSGQNLKEIAAYFGDIGPSAVSQNARRIEKRQQEDRDLRRTVETIVDLITRPDRETRVGR